MARQYDLRLDESMWLAGRILAEIGGTAVVE